MIGSADPHSNTLELFLPMLPLMPPELFTMNPPFEMVFSLNDGPRSVVHDGFKQRSRALGQAGKLWPKAQLFKQEQEMEWTHGWCVVPVLSHSLPRLGCTGPR